MSDTIFYPDVAGYYLIDAINELNERSIEISNINITAPPKHIGEAYNDKHVIDTVGLSIAYTPNSKELEELFNVVIAEEGLDQILKYFEIPNNSHNKATAADAKSRAAE